MKLGLIQAAKLAAFALLAPALTGCGPEYDRTDITAVHPSPLGGRMDYARIDVPAGMIVTAHIIAYDDDNHIMSTDLRARDTSVVEVEGVINEHDYAFFGLKPGITQIELRANDKVVLILDAVVSDQPPQP